MADPLDGERALRGEALPGGEPGGDHGGGDIQISGGGQAARAGEQQAARCDHVQIGVARDVDAVRANLDRLRIKEERAAGRAVDACNGCDGPGIRAVVDQHVPGIQGDGAAVRIEAADAGRVQRQAFEARPAGRVDAAHRAGAVEIDRGIAEQRQGADAALKIGEHRARENEPDRGLERTGIVELNADLPAAERHRASGELCGGIECREVRRIENDVVAGDPAARSNREAA